MLPTTVFLVLGIASVTEAVNERDVHHSDAYAPIPSIPSTPSNPPCGLPASATTVMSVCPEGPDIPDLTPTGKPPTLSPLPPWPVPSSPWTSDVFGDDWETTPPGENVPWTTAPAAPCSSIDGFTTLVISVTSTKTLTPCPDGAVAPACSDEGSGLSTGTSFVPNPLTTPTSTPQPSNRPSSITLPYEILPSGDPASSVVSSSSEAVGEPTITSGEPQTETGESGRHGASLLAVLLAILLSAILI